MTRRKVRKPQVRKADIDQRVAVLHDHPLQETADMTTAFLHEVMAHLLDGKEVYLRGFGTFQLDERKGRRRTQLTTGTFKKGVSSGHVVVDVRRKYYVSFRKAVQFKNAIRERFGKEKILKGVRDGKTGS